MNHRSKFIQLITLLLITSGCASETRPSQTPEQMLARRDQVDQTRLAGQRAVMERTLNAIKSQYDDYTAGRRAVPPVVDILIISGGGDWGAFGAGFLKGWGRIPKSDPLAKPDFTAVTGVSTGALIAPFAFLGDEDSIGRIENLYRNPKPDWVRQRGWLYFLPNNASFAEVPGLERELRENLTPDRIRRISEKGAAGHILVVNTTDVDNGESRVFDLVTEADHAVASGNPDRFQQILLASSGIPGAFPFRIIDGSLYVDGGVTGNILYGGRAPEEDSLPAQWQKAYPNLAIPKIRFWVLFNNQLRSPPGLAEPRWPSVVGKSVSIGIRASTILGIRHLFAIAEISRLKRKADVEVRIVAIPDNWIPPKEGVFIKETMDNLADIGERMGTDPSNWITQSPP